MPPIRSRLTVLTLLALLLTTPLARAAETPPAADAADVVLAGLKEYQAKGATEAITAWLKGSTLEGSKEALSQAGQFQQIETFYGKFQSWEILRTQAVSTASKLIYVSMNYEKGPVYARFLAYQKAKEWVLVNFDFNTKPEAILPYLLLEK